MTHPYGDQAQDKTATHVAVLLRDALADTPYDAGPYVRRAVAATRTRRRRTRAAAVALTAATAAGLVTIAIYPGHDAGRAARLTVATAPPTTSATVTAPNSSTTAPAQYPASVYPPPAGNGVGGVGFCPATTGIEPRSPEDKGAADVAALKFLNATSADAQRAFADQTLWSSLSAASVGVTAAQTDVSALSGPLESQIESSCGSAIAATSWTVRVCFARGDTFAQCEAAAPATAASLIVLRRGAHLLVWLETSQ